ncbi:MAG: hypothetical protein KJ698_01115 [Actinobacteria bacterium]|nr:hypothetical protein [Actinomycetota bacterium]MBU1492848.1 hypothetical protein [Actinomycetota bacterium]MBU1865199.1 hypothetical protein [Actinomycetota bacterium]
MAEVFLSPEIALPQYEGLREDPGRRKALERVDEILDALEEDPGRAWLRAHRFRSPPLWCVTFDASGEAWAILWSMDDDEDDRVLVDYIGPASFA